ncbi:MAG: hypothetical protein K2Y22_10485 [Candidatus Obscuribacterales bacterium]|nr:hypothetical protein [Candidatus Obscuribacterales bacterium]
MTARIPSRQPIVRINLAAKQKLDRMQTQTDMSQPELLDLAVTLLEREMLAQRFAQDLADLASNEKALKKYRQISSAFEGASGDGL